MSPWLQLIFPPACHFDRNSNCHPCFESSESERRLWTYSCVICKIYYRHLGILQHEVKTCCLFEVYLRGPLKRNWTKHSFQRQQWKRELFSCFWTLAVLHTILPLFLVWFLILVQFCLFLKEILLLLKIFFNLVIYFWLHWVFLAACRLFLIAASGSYSSLRCPASHCSAWTSHCNGFSYCRTQGCRADRLGSCGPRA